eukprot:3339959-Pleurochrysis_carterae.AAC.1
MCVREKGEKEIRRASGRGGKTWGARGSGSGRGVEGERERKWVCEEGGSGGGAARGLRSVAREEGVGGSVCVQENTSWRVRGGKRGEERGVKSGREK